MLNRPRSLSAANQHPRCGLPSRSKGSKRSKRLAKRENRTGAVLVEFALVVPVFVLMLVTCIEFCRLNMIRNLMNDAAYYASRHCIVPGATEAEATAEANRILAAMGTQGANISINNGAGLDENSPTVSVRITVPVSQNVLLASQFTGNLTLETEATMKTERYDGFYDASSQ
ncbi:MAG: TadE/TadG family type IV pilus assembly protein [Aureliella sp.]